ncbi:DUF2281 domain-containing protein [Moraxella nasibovis]|uniref:type II toxin-antitoxin system VapB family antitoxin n=1 Tax=Moraxella nasibovis TaxID=2904120 RepID=UPI0024101E7F|nr:DUF2281 domain-containing protein [Moraxella nasibovis]WFF39027.1 DUF2281 domain-containing protein [Moraxella nasibovis]
MQTKPIQDTHQAIHYLQSLPVNLQQELVDWINVFQQKHSDDAKPAKKRTAGTLKGKVVFADDFDEPLDDFKGYM